MSIAKFKLVIVTLIIASIFLSSCKQQSMTESITQQIATPWGLMPLKQISGQDLPCIGKYDNMIRIQYEKNSESDGSYNIVLTYYKQGDVFTDAKQYFTSKALDCGFKQESEQEGSLPSVKGPTVINTYTAEYSKNSDSLTISISVLKSEDGKDYSFVNIQYYHGVASDEEDQELEQEDSQNQEAQYQSENYFDQEQEVQALSQEAKTLNNFIKPVLKQVFSDAKLVESSTMTMSGVDYIRLKYVVKTIIDSEKVEVLKTSIESNDYSIASSELTSTDFSLLFMKQGKLSLTITGELNNYYIEVLKIKESS